MTEDSKDDVQKETEEIVRAMIQSLEMMKFWREEYQRNSRRLAEIKKPIFEETEDQ